MKCPSCGAEVHGEMCEYCGRKFAHRKRSTRSSRNYHHTASHTNSHAGSKGGCPQCKSNNISFKRERITTSSHSSSHKNLICTGKKSQSVNYSSYKTIGICQNCGHTWYPNAASSGSNSKKKLGRLYLVVAVVWVLVLIVAISGDEEANTSPTSTPPTSETIQANLTTSSVVNAQSGSEAFTTPNAEITNLYPSQITAANYSGPECWLLDEPSLVATDMVFDIYANVDLSSNNWHSQVKNVIALLWSQYSGHESVMFKIYNGIDSFNKSQPTYEELIAIWQNKPFSIVSDPLPTIIWYPNGGSGINAQQESEYWTP